MPCICGCAFYCREGVYSQCHNCNHAYSDHFIPCFICGSPNADAEYDEAGSRHVLEDGRRVHLDCLVKAYDDLVPVKPEGSDAEGVNQTPDGG